ncbi:adenylyltransferase/cytidyltransferase family protein [Oleiagrimonas sp. MCCC 1A03011]|uniref:adenylyltransferase/cytidyltransferase family protein n=1 Tax=Oleiagrimonas sp. MCCC 1A03011 TaxID=1926883 RepID=UPI000DC4DEDA|nr:adenylyltransferase/cytidyltransferase family protein [Oleiagrimonas sp. MCCC 1A03011]RAP56869.1 glycerol-3-phosphate cytidiltransferase [Oleiagrimonas sp. MCCC 1A03011]
MSKTVLTYGTFDLFHVGHLNLLERLRELGDRLIVGVSTDAFNTTKGKQTIVRFEDRLRIVQNIKCVDHAFAENSWAQKAEDIRQFKVNVFGMGNDWEGQFDELKPLCKVVYLPRTEGISSTRIKDALRVLDKAHVEELKQALGVISTIVERFE